MFTDFNRQIIDEFRANRGQVGGPFAGYRLLLLTTTGARTGARHTTPLAYLPDEGGRKLVIASAGGAPTHPAWYHNLRADPRVTVEDGPFTFRARAVVQEGADRARLFARAVEADSGWAEYQAKTSRVIPVVALEPIEGGPDAESWGDALVAIHGAFRRELAVIREEVGVAGPGLGAQLRVNCLAVCQGLHHHHAGEDGQVFPFLDARHPELAGVLERLRREHRRIAELLDELQGVVSSGDTDPATLRAEVDRLTSELEAHLDYEEEHLVPVLNAVTG